MFAPRLPPTERDSRWAAAAYSRGARHQPFGTRLCVARRLLDRVSRPARRARGLHRPSRQQLRRPTRDEWDPERRRGAVVHRLGVVHGYGRWELRGGRLVAECREQQLYALPGDILLLGRSSVLEWNVLPRPHTVREGLRAGRHGLLRELPKPERHRHSALQRLREMFAGKLHPQLPDPAAMSRVSVIAPRHLPSCTAHDGHRARSRMATAQGSPDR